MASVRFIVRGLVQGVFFRASTRARARELGLLGYAKNLADGSVEVIASGSASALDDLEHWLQRGPPSARVERVERATIAEQQHDDFVTR